MTWRYISREEKRVRRAALKMKRMMFSHRIMSTGAVERANDMLLLRHHLGSYQERGCGNRIGRRLALRIRS